MNPRRLAPLVLALLMGRALAAPTQHADDTQLLTKLLAAEGYRPGHHFKAVVARVEVAGEGDVRVRWYSHGTTADDRDNWWPASTIKLYAAIAALERASELKISPEAKLELRYKKDPTTTTLAKLIRLAITPSNNQAYDRLVEFAGVERLNDELFTAANGLGETVLLRAYYGRVRDKKSGRGTLRHSPEIGVTDGKRKLTLPEKRSDKRWECFSKKGDEANCTTLRNLTEALRRVMLHEKLDPSERYDISPEGLELLRGALSGKRSRGVNVPKGIRAAFKDRPIHTYSKPGYAAKWFSDAVYVHAPAHKGKPERIWLVGMANWPGRESLDEASKHVGTILAADKLP